MEAPHSKLLAQAAKTHLVPLGVVRKGRSRIWLDDRSWFVIVVEFQPSGFSKGSYLNVGAHFLWTWNNFVSFDLGHRVEEFHRFDSDTQFETVADELAKQAVTEVQALRSRLPGPEAVAFALPADPEGQGWESYHRAVSLALGGKVDLASSLFARLIEPPHHAAWDEERAGHCKKLRDLLVVPSTYREAICKFIHERRAALRLSQLHEPLNDQG